MLEVSGARAEERSLGLLCPGTPLPSAPRLEERGLEEVRVLEERSLGLRLPLLGLALRCLGFRPSRQRNRNPLRAALSNAQTVCRLRFRRATGPRLRPHTRTRDTARDTALLLGMFYKHYKTTNSRLDLV